MKKYIMANVFLTVVTILIGWGSLGVLNLGLQRNWIEGMVDYTTNIALVILFGQLINGFICAVLFTRRSDTEGRGAACTLILFSLTGILGIIMIFFFTMGRATI